MSKTIVVCPKCKGKGKIREINWDYGFMLPFAALMGDTFSQYICNSCNGKGYIEVKE